MMIYIWHIGKPPSLKRVLCTVKDQYGIRDLAIGSYEYDHWYLCWGKTQGRVIAWTELPEPFYIKMKEVNVMQKTLYMTEETWRQLQHITGEDRSYSDVIRELIYREYEDRMHDEAGGAFDGMDKK